jgi:hypothetical protein
LLLIGDFVGVIFAYKYLKLDRFVARLQNRLNNDQMIFNAMNYSMPKQLLFVHHSVGDNWLNYGGLKAQLLSARIGVHSCTYGDEIGEHTDMYDWAPKFKNDIEKIFKFDYHPNNYYKNNRQNDIIMFKSCYPNSHIVGEGEAPGNPTEKIKTIWNYKAVFNELKDVFKEHPQKTFIYVTAPPMVPKETTPESAKLARLFNEWITGQFVKEYKDSTGLNNFLVFDLFDILADKEGMLKLNFRANDYDSHPNEGAGQAATQVFMSFLKDNGFIEAN